MNWYKIATKEKKPYKIYQIGRGEFKEIEELTHIWAYSSEQARMFAIKKSSKLQDFLEYCRTHGLDGDIQARIDQEKWDDTQKYQAYLKEKEERQIRDAWWNK